MTWTAQDPKFKKLSAKEKAENLPTHLLRIIQLAESHGLNPQKIWIYGSRARGDARENSDFDLAFEINDQKSWSAFVTEIEDDPPSLYRYDIVDIKTADKKLKESIAREGVLIYERK